MYFRTSGRVGGLFLNTGESALFKYQDGEATVLITLRGPTKEEGRSGGSDAQYVCDLELEPPGDIRQMFEAMSQGRMPAGSKDASEGLETPEGTVRYFPSVAKDGAIGEGSSPPVELLPDAYNAFMDAQIYRLRRRYLVTTVGTVRWRYAMEGPHAPLRGGDSAYSFDGKTWHPMPTGITARVGSRSATRISEERRNEIQELVSGGGAEPLGHELLREAWANEGTNNRSALILGVAAAEAGVKQCISRLVPDASWLVETGPSPALNDMLKNYLPTLPVKSRIKGVVPIVPKAVRNVLDAAVKQRNKLVHVGIGQPTSEEVLDTLEAVEDVLWLCDFYCGFDWALNHLSPATQKALGVG